VDSPSAPTVRGSSASCEHPPEAISRTQDKQCPTKSYLESKTLVLIDNSIAAGERVTSHAPLRLMAISCMILLGWKIWNEKDPQDKAIATESFNDLKEKRILNP
jgi:hypothetical protein